MPTVKLNRAIKYRAYPTEGQAVLLAKTFGCVRFVWNRMLTDAQTFLNETGVFFIPTPAKYKKEFPFLKEVDSLALANTQLDLKAANKRHLDDKKVGTPHSRSFTRYNRASDHRQDSARNAGSRSSRRRSLRQYPHCNAGRDSATSFSRWDASEFAVHTLR